MDNEQKIEFLKNLDELLTSKKTNVNYTESEIIGVIKEFLKTYAPEIFEEFGMPEISFSTSLPSNTAGGYCWANRKIYLNRNIFNDRIIENGFGYALLRLISTTTHEYRHYCQHRVVDNNDTNNIHGIDVNKMSEGQNFDILLDETFSRTDIEILYDIRSDYLKRTNSTDVDNFVHKRFSSNVSSIDLNTLLYITNYIEVDANNYSYILLSNLLNDITPHKTIDQTKLLEVEEKYLSIPAGYMSVNQHYLIGYLRNLVNISKKQLQDYAYMLELFPTSSQHLGNESFMKYKNCFTVCLKLYLHKALSDKENAWNNVKSLLKMFIDNGNSYAIDELWSYIVNNEHFIVSKYNLDHTITRKKFDDFFKDYIFVLLKKNKLNMGVINSNTFWRVADDTKINEWAAYLLDNKQYDFLEATIDSYRRANNVLVILLGEFNPRAEKLLLNCKNNSVDFDELYQYMRIAHTLDLAFGWKPYRISDTPIYQQFKEIQEKLITYAYSYTCALKGATEMDLELDDFGHFIGLRYMEKFVKKDSEERIVEVYGKQELKRRKKLAKAEKELDK